MRRRTLRSVTAILGLSTAAAIAAGGCGDATSEATVRLNVFAAASLGPAITEIGQQFEAANTEVEIVLNIGGSSSLASQIRGGAPADVFASADLATMATVAGDAGSNGEPAVFATNSAAILVAVGNPLEIDEVSDLAADDVVVVQCAPEVPCGAYARAIYERAGVSVTPRSFEQSVAGVVTKVVLGEADAGIVYETDVIGTTAAEGVPIPADQNVVAEYPIVALEDGEQAELAREFVEFVLGDGRSILTTYGFGTP